MNRRQPLSVRCVLVTFLVFSFSFSGMKASAEVVEVVNNLGACSLGFPGFEIVGSTSTTTPTPFYHGSLGYLPGYTFQIDNSLSANGGTILFVCSEARVWYVTNTLPAQADPLLSAEQFGQYLIREFYRHRSQIDGQNSSACGGRCPLFKKKAAVTGTRGSVRIDDGVYVSTASPGFVTLEATTLDSIVGLAPLALPFVITAAAPGDWLEIHAGGEVVGSSMLSDFPLDEFFAIEIPDEWITADPAIPSWTFYLGSAGSGFSEVLVVTDFEELPSVPTLGFWGLVVALGGVSWLARRAMTSTP